MSGAAPFKFWLVVLGLVCATVYSFWYGFKAWRKNRVVEDTPTSRVRSAAQGYVELTGHGLPLPKAENKGPLTGRPCTWWRYKIEERRSSGRSRSWTTVQSDTSAAPFLLDDGTGQCLIDPRGAEVFPGATDVWYGGTDWPEVRIPDGEGILGKVMDTLLTDRYRYTEYRLQPHETVYAIGTLRSLGGVSVDSPDRAAAELLRDWKQDQATLLQRFDTNHDGVLDGEEWDRARAAARAQAAEKLGAEPPTPGMHVLSNPTDGRAFLLAACDGDTLARKLRLKAVGGIAAFVGSCGALTWMLTHV
jgi:hypothetical protein